LHYLAPEWMNEAEVGKLAACARLYSIEFGSKFTTGGDLEPIAIGGKIFQKGLNAATHHAVGFHCPILDVSRLHAAETMHNSYDVTNAGFMCLVQRLANLPGAQRDQIEGADAVHNVGF